MARQPNRKMIGLFLVTGFAIFAIVLASLLKGKLFSDRENTVVMYFEESIKGLSVGSPVVLKGVKIGEVSKIRIVVDSENLSFRTPVYAKMQSKGISAKNLKQGKEVLDALVEKGLRARLISQSYVTGQLMIELEMLPGTPIKYHGKSKLVEIPTALSPMGELSRGLQRLPIAEGVKNFTEFFESLNKTMPEVNRIIKDIDKIVSRNKGASAEMLDNINRATINVGKAAKSMQNLTDYLERHPEALLKGKK